jgi:hypothetical protein
LVSRVDELGGSQALPAVEPFLIAALMRSAHFTGVKFRWAILHDPSLGLGRQGAEFFE